MGSIAAKLSVLIGADVDEAVRGVKEVGQGLGGLASQGSRVGDVFKGVFGAQLLQNGIYAFKNMAKEAVSVYTSYESLSLSLQQLAARELLVSGNATDMTDALAQSSGTAENLLGWVEKLAMASPFDAQGVTTALRTAMAYGFTTKEAKRLTEATIDYASATGSSVEGMNTIALALGQIKAKGSLAGQEVLQLVNAGIDVNGILARAFGVTTQEIVKMRESGLIPAEAAIDAIVSTLETDFSGASEKAADTFGGLISTLNEVKDIGLREFFGGMFAELKPILKDVIELMSDPAMRENLRESGQAFGEFTGEVLNGILDLVQWFGSLDDETQNLILKLGTAAIAIGPIFNGISSLAGGVKSLGSLLPGLTTGLGGASTAIGSTGTAAGLAANPIGIYVVALAAVVAAGIKVHETSQLVKSGVESVAEGIDASYSSAKSAEDALEGYKNAIESVNQSVKDQGLLAKMVVPTQKLQKESLAGISDQLAVLSQDYEEYVEYMGEALLASGALTKHEEKLFTQYTDTAMVIEALAWKYDLVTEAMYKWDGAAGDTLTLMEKEALYADRTGEAFLEAGASADGFSEGIAGIGDEAKTASERLDELNSGLGNTIAAFSQQIAFDIAVDVEGIETRLQQVRDALDAGLITPETAQQLTDYLYTVETVQEAQGGIISQQEAINRIVDKTGMEYQTVYDLVTKTGSGIGGWDAAFTKAIGAANAFAGTVDGINTKVRSVQDQVRALDAMQASIDILFNYNGNGLPKKIFSDIPIPQAEGGDWMVTRPTLFLAGEAGPERAIFIPQNGGGAANGGAASSGGNGGTGLQTEAIIAELRRLAVDIGSEVANALIVAEAYK